MTQLKAWSMAHNDLTAAGRAKKRGRIPQEAWPRVLARHRDGDTLAEIAREFECTPSAISYVIKKAEAAGIKPDMTPLHLKRSEGRAEPDVPAAAPDPQPIVPEMPQPVAVPRRPAAPAAVVDDQPYVSMAQPLTGHDRPSPLRQPLIDDQPIIDTPPSSFAPAQSDEPIDETDERFMQATDAFREAYRIWQATPGEAQAAEELQGTLHDLRRVLARVEISLASTARDDRARQTSIPAPGHRARNRVPPSFR